MVSTFEGLILELESYGIFEIVLPFLLVFTLIFAVLQRIKLFGDGKKSINIVVALIMGILTIVPHVTGRYPANYDPVVIINALLPGASVLAVVIILVLFLWGMFGGEWAGGSVPTIAIIGVMVVMGYIFGTTVGWWEEPAQVFGGWWTSGLTTIIIMILIFGLIVWAITSDKKSMGGGLIEGVKEFGKLFKE